MTKQPATRRPLTRRILAVYAQASPAHREAGLEWYRVAHAVAVRLDPANPRRAAGVLAALSPMTNWDANVVLAERAYRRGYAAGTLGNSVRAANRILAGEDPAIVLCGPKVAAFFALIDNPDDATAVCIDRHAVDIAVALRQSDTERSARYRLHRRGWYGRFARAYRRAATVLGVTPAQVQAVTWLAWRDLALTTRRGFAVPTT